MKYFWIQYVEASLQLSSWNKKKITSAELLCEIKFYGFSCINVTLKTNQSQRLLTYHPCNSYHSGKKILLE